jgi:cytosine/adenosine deaminase-related metal-dependent hydrolase
MGSDDGVIAVGRRADLVLLNADPLADIAHTAAIEAVVIGGALADRAFLDRLLEAVRRAHAQSRKFDLQDYR